MIKKADVLDRLRTLIGQELTSQHLHEALFCEKKHQKILRRFSFGTHTYVQYKIKQDNSDETKFFVDITIPGNPNVFQVMVKEKDGKMLIESEPRINFGY